MSGSTPGSFRSNADKAKKLKSYQDTLDLQIELSKNQEIKSKQYQRNLDLGIGPELQPIRSVEQELEDITLQKNMALKHLQTILPKDAIGALNVLGEDIDEVVLFNRNWEGFREKTRNQKLISKAYFRVLWDRYKDYLASTGDTGIEIGVSAADFDRKTQDVRDDIQLSRQDLQVLRDEIMQRVREVDGLPAADIRRIREFLAQEVMRGNAGVINQIRQAMDRGDAGIERLRVIMESVRDEVQMTRQEAQDAKQEILEAIDHNARLSARERRELTEFLERVIRDENTQVMTEIRRAARGASEAQTNRLMRAIRNGNLETIMQVTTEINQTTRQITGRLNALDAQLNETSLRLMSNDELKGIIKQLTGTRTDTELKAAMGADNLRKDTMVRFIMNRRGSPPPPAEEDDGWLAGTGLRKKRHIIIKGRGLAPPPPQERYSGFGKYVIHTPSLQKGVLNLKYPSLANIAGLPSTPMSQGFRDLMMSTLQTGKLNMKAYRDLPAAEREFFNKAARKAGLEDVLGIDDDAYEINEMRRHLVQRYEILKGEVMAGNDSPQLKKELKQVLVRMADNGLVTRTQALSLMVELI